MNKQEVFKAVVENIYILVEKRIGKPICVGEVVDKGELGYLFGNYTKKDKEQLKSIVYSQAIIYQEYIDEILGDIDELCSE